MTRISELEAALSLERFSRYVGWAGGNRGRALELYVLNTRLSEALYTPLQVLELVLRNRIHSVMSAAHGQRWFETDDLIMLPRQKERIAFACKELAGERKDFSEGRIIAALSFSFWTAMVSPDYESLWRSSLRAIATNENGRSLARKQLSRPLTVIRVLRNRVAHHEPILHWHLVQHHQSIVQITRWLSPAAAAWCSDIDRFPSVYPDGGYHLAAAEMQNP